MASSNFFDMDDLDRAEELRNKETSQKDAAVPEPTAPATTTITTSTAITTSAASAATAVPIPNPQSECGVGELLAQSPRSKSKRPTRC